LREVGGKKKVFFFNPHFSYQGEQDEKQII